MLGRSDSTHHGSGGRSGEGRFGATSDRPIVGGRVDESGLAYVHEGEVIMPAPDAEAEIDLLRSDLGADIRITLPVVVQIASSELDEERTAAIVDETLRRLRNAVEAQSIA